MSHLLAISPHLDDAAFSIGGTLTAHRRAGGRVTILTCFTGNVANPPGFALACQLDKGLPAEADYMALRRAEDRAACAIIDAQPVHLPFLEAPHRGYDDAVALFGGLLPGDAIVGDLARALRIAVDALAPDRILGPRAIGGHVDHLAVRAALAQVAPAAMLWDDWPYVDRADAHRSGPATCRTPLDSGLRATRAAMCECYVTQLDYQFGGAGALRERLSAITEECLYAA